MESQQFVGQESNGMRRGISQKNLIIIIAIVAGCFMMGCMVLALLVGIILPALGAARRTANQMRNQSQMRGVHQSMVIFAQNNNTYMPGLDDKGMLLSHKDPAFKAAMTSTDSGASMSGRYYMLLNANFVAGDLLINPQDAMTPWSSSSQMVTPNQFSYSLLRIGSGPGSTTIGRQDVRAEEWKDNANSRALLIADRNTASVPKSDKVRSVWSTSSGPGADWKGSVLWGDNHAEFLNATNGKLGVLSLETKYGKTVNVDDFLFNEVGASGKDANASAMFGYTSENY
jgi:hypothetical protein